MTLRPASATWSSAVTPAVLLTVRRGVSGGGAPAIASSTSSERRRVVIGLGRDRGIGLAKERSLGFRPRPPRPRRRRRTREGAAPPLFRLAPRTAESAASSLLPLATREGRIGPERRRKSLEPRLVALDEFGLELDEATDDPLAGHDVDLVEAQLDTRRAVAQQALAPELTDGHDLDQRGVAGQFHDERARVRGRPVRRSGCPVGRSFQLLASDRAAGALCAGSATSRTR